ncbi:ABC transporter ATP-binding protein [Lachnoclostridium sp. An118]|uniref:ABC transporter ATP-binding protein n=1 Tax=Lachnoclostridium sp. An118 TaxID=1965547 RepID=UPI000B370B6A|nr:ABC transporter ATP-binding protein [Lachnoclostridium sp. An118]OUQ48327.1 peptide ABC transporter ATP-binding protein [Lachnoclostridium sp. An118]
MELLRCTGVKKVYGEGENRVEALRGIDLTLERGELVSVTGASGSGKSTLLHILGSVDRPTEGAVLVGGTDISRLDPRQAALYRRRRVGLIYQFYNLIPSLTVEKNMQMPLLLDRRKPDPDYFRRIVESLGLEEKLQALPSQLSGGQQQRVAVGRALMSRPLLLLADEPTGNLDRRNARELMDLLHLFHRNFRQTILLVTHDERLALEAERIITLEDGRIVSDRKVR